jgi:hypothetical protein
LVIAGSLEVAARLATLICGPVPGSKGEASVGKAVARFGGINQRRFGNRAFTLARHVLDMLAVLLAASVAAAPPAHVPSATHDVLGDPLSWYGYRIGVALPEGPHAGEHYGQYRDGLFVPEPWTDIEVVPNEAARIGAVSLREECCTLVVDAGISTRNIGAKALLAHGQAVRREMEARLGPPSSSFDEGRGNYVMLIWDFTVRVTGCRGDNAIFEGAAHEPSGRLLSARLDYSPDGVHFEVRGRQTNSDGSPREDIGAEERARQNESCRRDAELERWLHSPTRVQDQERACRATPDTCTDIRGAIIYHGRGQVPQKVPCAPGSPAVVCLHFPPTGSQSRGSTVIESDPSRAPPGS